MRQHDFLDYNARERPDADFAAFRDARISYADAQREANRIANALVALGLAPGDRVALLAKNCLDYVITPDQTAWHPITQDPRPAASPAAAASTNAPAKIERPKWAD